MKFYGKIGYGENVETAPGVYSDVITEKNYYGDIIRNARTLQQGDKINDDLIVNNSVSVVADAYAMQNFQAIRYVNWAGTYWTVSEVDVQSPRLVLRLGGIYNGERAQ